MKKATILFLSLVISIASFSQQSNPTPVLTKQDLLAKSKKQKTAAWIMLSGGVALGIGGATWAGSDWEASGPGALMIAGGVSVLGSIPLFIASGRNKKKAMSMSFKNEKVPVLQQNGLAYRAIPSLHIKFSL